MKILNKEKKSFPGPSEIQDFKRGFTLIEIIVSLAILISVVIGIFSLITRNISVANLIKNETIAANLAVEGMEIIRNFRDSDWHVGNSFGTSIPNGTWRVNWDSTSLLSDDGSFLRFDSVTGRYNYTTGGNSLFRRSITISNGPDGGSANKRVEVTVTWTERGLSRDVSVEGILYNWR